MSWFLLILAGIFEICWPTGFKMAQSSEHNALWVLFSALGMTISGILLYFAQKEIPIGVAYAVWVGIGALGTYLISVNCFGENASLLSITGIALIVGGVITLKISCL